MAIADEEAAMATTEDPAPLALRSFLRTNLEALLQRKLQNIPGHIMPFLTIDDVLRGSPQALVNPDVPDDLQLSFLLRNHRSIEHYAGRPIKNESQQDLNTTRAIFFYHRHEAYQFQRYHDISRWNLAFFTALLSDDPATPTSTDHSSSPSDDDDVGIHAQTFMTSYLAAVLERHNSPANFTQREDFVRRWKNSDWDLFTRFASGHKKLLKKEMSRLTKAWERELDKALRDMGSEEYERRVAPFVGSVVPGRKDQGLRREEGHLCGAMVMEAEDLGVVKEKTEELVDALCVPVGEERYGGYEEYREDVATPTDVSDAITWMQTTEPADMLPVLMRLFPAGE